MNEYTNVLEETLQATLLELSSNGTWFDIVGSDFIAIVKWNMGKRWDVELLPKTGEILAFKD